MNWLNPITWVKLISGLTGLLELIRELVKYLREQRNKRSVERAKEAIDQAPKTGDQRPIEEEFGHESPGKPTDHRIPDLKTRPVRDRSQ